jgi:hypothetical protein
MVSGMNDRLRTRLAAGGTVAALGVLATVALAAGSSGPADQPASSATVPPPQVRTQIERRTVHVRRHRDDRVQAPTQTQTAAAAPAAAAAAPAPTPATTAAAAPAVADDHGRDHENEVEHENEAGDDHRGRGRDGGGGDD